MSNTFDLPAFQILSLDGGGIKGILSAAILAAIEEDTDTNIIDHFDLITGTSTGGIIALGLGLGMRPREIVEFYLKHSPKIFPNYYGLKEIQHWFYRKFSSKPLSSALQDCFKDKTLGDSKRALVIPSYNLGDDNVYLFKTPHHPNLRRDYKVPIWKVALATSAAPTFFPCTREVDRIRLIDGGVWANNPTMVGIIEALSTLEVPLHNISVLSVGTTNEVSSRSKWLNNGGIMAWAILGKAALNVITRGQSIGVNNQARFLIGKEKFERLDPAVPYGEFALDGINKVDDLIGKAAHYSRHFIPTFEEKFKNHKAKPLSPLYQLKKEAL